MITRILFCTAAAALTVAAGADTVQLGEQTLTDVYVTKSGDDYYIMEPEDGSVKSIPASELSQEDIAYSQDREALHERWLEKAAQRLEEAQKQMPPAPSQDKPPVREFSVDPSGTPQLRLKGNAELDPERAAFRAQVRAQEAQRRAAERAQQLALEQQKLELQREAEEAAFQERMQQMRLEEQRLRLRDNLYGGHYGGYYGGPGFYRGPRIYIDRDWHRRGPRWPDRRPDRGGDAPPAAQPPDDGGDVQGGGLEGTPYDVYPWSMDSPWPSTRPRTSPGQTR